MTRLRQGLITLATIATAVVLIALASGGCSGSDGDSTTVDSAATSPTPARTAPTTGASTTPRPEPSRNAGVVVRLRPQKSAHGARGTVRLQRGKGSLLKLTLTVSSPQRYGVVLWTSARHYRGLYSGFPGTNTQKFAISGPSLLRYRWLAVGQQVVRNRIVRRRIQGRRVRIRQQRIVARHLLRIPTTTLVNRLLSAH